MGFFKHWLFVLALAVSGAAGTAHAQQAVDLFSGEPSAAGRARAASEPIPGISREIRGPVSIFSLSERGGRSLRTATRGPRRLRIALPAGESATCEFPAEPDSVDNSDAKLLAGSVVDGAGQYRCDLVVGDDGVVGHIDTEDGRYRIVPVGDGNHAVVKLRTNRFERENEPRALPNAQPDRPERQRGGRLLNNQLCDQRMNASLPPRTFGPIRVMVLYTPKAKAESVDIDADIALMMSGLRRSFSAASTGGNFSVAVELAHAQMVDYQESPQGMGGDLDRMSNPMDPIFGVVPELRGRYRADLVHLLISANEGDGCGLGWLNSNPHPDGAQWGLSVSDLECATGNYSFIHELGHNIGMEHDRAVVNQPDPEGTNYGYVMIDREVRSVMAYNTACDAQNIYCQRLPYFSSPRLRVGDTPFGRAAREREGAYNVEALCRGAAVVAGFRDPYSFISFENQDVSGVEIGKYKGLGYDACAAKCEGDNACEAYTFDKWNDWCFLKGSVTGLRLEPKAMSGLKPWYGEPPRSGNPIEMVRYRGKYFPGTGYETLRATSMEQCERICEADGHCMGFSFYAGQNRCEAFATLGEYFSKDGVDSGAKTQPLAAADN